MSPTSFFFAPFEKFAQLSCALYKLNLRFSSLFSIKWLFAKKKSRYYRNTEGVGTSFKKHTTFRQNTSSRPPATSSQSTATKSTRTYRVKLKGRSGGKTSDSKPLRRRGKVTISPQHKHKKNADCYQNGARLYKSSTSFLGTFRCKDLGRTRWTFEVGQPKTKGA